MRPASYRHTPPWCVRNARSRLQGPGLFVIAASLLACSLSGCINSMVMAGKVIFGDAHVMSPFEQRTGVSLSEGEHKVVFVCTAPGSTSEEFDTLAADLQAEVHLQLKKHGVTVINSPDLNDMPDASASGFNPEAVARVTPDASYILHADVERFSGIEDASPDLLRGRASGMIYAYEIHRSSSPAGRPRVLKVFFQEFHCEYPASQPVFAGQMPARVFYRRFVDHLAELVGRTFYDVPTADAFP